MTESGHRGSARLMEGQRKRPLAKKIADTEGVSFLCFQNWRRGCRGRVVRFSRISSSARNLLLFFQCGLQGEPRRRALELLELNPFVARARGRPHVHPYCAMTQPPVARPSDSRRLASLFSSRGMNSASSPAWSAKALKDFSALERSLRRDR